MTERTIQTNGVEICTEAFGNPADPAMLLIMGAGGSMLKWETPFVERLVSAGRYAIRYDNRDTGQSTCYAEGEPPYTLQDMSADAIAVLDAYGIDTAHVLGRSMGGMITQHVMLDHPNRITSATLIYSSPSPGVAASSPADKDSLPGISEKLMTAFTSAPGLEASADEKMAHQIETLRILNGNQYSFDADKARALINLEMMRARNFAASGNHAIAIRNSPPWRQRLGEIRIPTLVVHGTEDPILPFPHGEALAAEISDAQLMVLQGVGHALPEGIWDELIPRLIRHTDR